MVTNFWFYIFWVLLTLLQVIIFKKYAYDKDDKKVLIPRLRYFLWILSGFIPFINIALCIILPIGLYAIEDIRINTGIGLMKKCRIDK